MSNQKNGSQNVNADVQPADPAAVRASAQRAAQLRAWARTVGGPARLDDVLGDVVIAITAAELGVPNPRAQR